MEDSSITTDKVNEQAVPSSVMPLLSPVKGDNVQSRGTGDLVLSSVESEFLDGDSLSDIELEQMEISIESDEDIMLTEDALELKNDENFNNKPAAPDEINCASLNKSVDKDEGEGFDKNANAVAVIIPSPVSEDKSQSQLSMSSPNNFFANVNSDKEEYPEKNAITSQEDDSKKQVEQDYTSGLQKILCDARFFLVKSNNEDNVNLSKSHGLWSTPPQTDWKLNKAFTVTRNVILIFSVTGSGKFSGFARLASKSNFGGPHVNWVAPPVLSKRGAFKIDWISNSELPSYLVNHLFNPWNQGKNVKVGRDGQEIEPRVGKELCRLFPIDANSKVDWNKVLKQSRDARHTKVESPMLSRWAQEFRDQSDANESKQFASKYQGPPRALPGKRHRYSEYDGYEGARCARNNYSYNGRTEGKRRFETQISSNRKRFCSSAIQNYRNNRYGTMDNNQRLRRTLLPPLPPFGFPPPPPFDCMPHPNIWLQASMNASLWS